MTDSIPKDPYNLRACLLCHLVKTTEQFDKGGCDNCEQYLGMKHNREMVSMCTTTTFSGLIGLAEPNDSWVARWQRISQKNPGIYAVAVSGKLPSGIQRELRGMGVVESKPPR